MPSSIHELRKKIERLKQELINAVSEYNDYLEDQKKMKPGLTKEDITQNATFTDQLSSAKLSYDLGIAHCNMITDETGNPVDYRFVFVNDIFARIIGMTKSDIENRTATEIFPGIEKMPDDFIRKFGKIAFEGGSLTTGTYSASLNKWVSTYIYSPKTGQFISILSDISERIKNELETITNLNEIEAILSCIADGVVVYDRDGHIIRTNAAAEKIFKLNEDEKELSLTQRATLRYRIWKEDGSTMKTEEFPAYRSAVNAETITNELLLLEIDGEKKWIDMSASPLYISGKHSGGIISASDVTKRKQTEERLRANEQRLRGIFDNAAIGIAEVDANEQFIEVNNRICDILGYTKEELLKKTVHEITSLEDRPNSNKMNEKLHLGEIDVFDYEKRYIKSNGSLVWVHVSASAVRDIRGNYLGTIRTIEDISERKRAEDENRKIQTILKQAGILANLGAWELEYKNQVDIDQNTLRWSDQVFRIFGYEPGSVNVTNIFFYEHVHPDDRQRVRDELQNSIKGMKPYSVEHRIRRADGVERMVIEYAEITYDRVGQPMRIMGAVQDITERKVKEEKLKESEKKFRSLFENITEGVAIHEVVFKNGKPVDYKILDANPAFRNHTGIDPETARGELASKLFDSPEPPYLDKYAAVALTGQPIRFDIFFPPLNRHFVISAISPAKNQFATVFEDVTEQKHNEMEIKKKNEELTRFIYTVSHDLKSPLVTIKSFTAYLKEDLENQDKPAQDKDINYIQNAADKMGKLLDELLELSRIGRKEKPKTKTTLRTVAQSAIDLVAGRIATNKVRIRFSGPSIILFGHTDRFVQLFQNLIDNSAKFMGNQPEPLIEIGAFIDEDKNNEIVLYVRDNGSGIDPRYGHKIFGLFEKMDNITEGTGIGLALVKRIVEVHGGKIWFESEGIGKGATFYFTLEGTQVL